MGRQLVVIYEYLDEKNVNKGLDILCGFTKVFGEFVYK